MSDQAGGTLEQAMRLHRDGELASAALLYRKILKEEPRHFEALSLLGSICLRQGEADEAVATLGKALEIDPQSIEAHLNLGYALSRLERFDEALESFWQAVRLRPDFVDAHIAMATVFGALDRPADAAASWRRAVELKPEAAELLNNLGSALGELERHREAAACYRRAIRLQPATPELHHNLGLALLNLGRAAVAEARFRRALEMTPEYSRAHMHLGIVLGKLGRYEEAAESLGRAIECDPDEPDAYTNLGSVLIRLRRSEDAAAVYEQAIEIDPGNVAAHVGLGTALLKFDQRDRAMSCFRRALEIDEANGKTHNQIGAALVEAQQLEEGIRHLEAAIRYASDHPDAHRNLGVALRTVGRTEEGQREIERAIELAPQRADFYLSLAISGKRFAAGDQHLAAMERLARNPRVVADESRMPLHFALGAALADIGRHDEAAFHLLAGNKLKRQQTDYDEAATLGNFERIRAVFSAEAMQRNAGFGHPSDLPVFIVGMPRSGTTLVEQIAASHPRVFGAGELEDINWVIRRAGLATINISGLDWIPEKIGYPLLAQIGAAYVARVGALAPTASRITDKMPINFQNLGIIHLALPNARIIHVRRDPIDTCLSCFSLLFTGDQPFTYDLAELGRYYRGYSALMEHWREVLPPGVMLEVQYEDVVADLEGEARRIVAHCRLDWDDACLAFHENRRPVATASVAQVRQPIYRSSVSRWRPYAKMLGPLLAELGVDPETA